MNEIPVVTRSQRRFERRQMLLMIVLVMAITIASFFLGVMVGERGTFTASHVEPPRLPMAQVAPPPLPSSVPAGPQKLTFYDDLPRGNAAPLGSGINLPKGGYSAPPPPPPPAPAAAPPAPATAPVAAAPAVKPPPPAPAPAPEAAAPRASAGGAYVVQVSATKDQAEAKRVVEKLKGKGFPAASERADLGAKGIWYRVTVGPYGDQGTAEKASGQLKGQGYAGIVRKR